MGERRGKYKIQVVKSEGKRPLGRPRCRARDNMVIDCKVKEKAGVDMWFRIGSAAGSFTELSDSTKEG
jgi:hypothetical protein